MPLQRENIERAVQQLSEGKPIMLVKDGKAVPASMLETELLGQLAVHHKMGLYAYIQWKKCRAMLTISVACNIAMLAIFYI